MREAKNPPTDSEDAQLDSLESRILNILDLAEGQAARAINHTMVVAHWLIGRELFALQGGEPRAGYGTRFLEKLSRRLSQRGKRGYSVTNLRYFRLFYKIFPNRLPEIHHLRSDELVEAAIPEPKGFFSKLSWTHYRTLTSVEERAERLFYEIEAVQAGWSTEELTRAIAPADDVTSPAASRSPAKNGFRFILYTPYALSLASPGMKGMFPAFRTCFRETRVRLRNAFHPRQSSPALC